MNKMKEQHITLKIADVAPMSINIDRDTEELVREAERAVNRVWSIWRRDFSEKTSKEVLAMTAYQYAKLYYQLQHTIENQQKLLNNFEGELDRLLQLTTESEDGDNINNSDNSAL